MAWEPVSDGQQGMAQVLGDLGQEGDQPRRGDGDVRPQREVQADPPAPGRERQGGDDGHFLAGPLALIEDGGMHAGRSTEDRKLDDSTACRAVSFGEVSS